MIFWTICLIDFGIVFLLFFFGPNSVRTFWAVSFVFQTAQPSASQAQHKKKLPFDPYRNLAFAVASPATAHFLPVPCRLFTPMASHCFSTLIVPMPCTPPGTSVYVSFARRFFTRSSRYLPFAGTAEGIFGFLTGLYLLMVVVSDILFFVRFFVVSDVFLLQETALTLPDQRPAFIVGFIHKFLADDACFSHDHSNSSFCQWLVHLQMGQVMLAAVSQPFFFFCSGLFWFAWSVGLPMTAVSLLVRILLLWYAFRLTELKMQHDMQHSSAAMDTTVQHLLSKKHWTEKKFVYRVLFVYLAVVLTVFFVTYFTIGETCKENDIWDFGVEVLVPLPLRFCIFSWYFFILSKAIFLDNDDY
jgi:hypothetical protein